MAISIFLFSAVTVVTVLLLAAPLLRRPSTSAVRALYDVQVYKDQLGEVERDRQRGILPDDQAEAARLEIQRRLLAADAEARAHTGKAPPGRTLRVGLAVGMVAVVPALALGLYVSLGSPGTPDRPYVERTAERLGLTEAQVQEFSDQAEMLKAGLESNPTNQSAWFSLAQTQSALGRFGEALASYERGLRLGPVGPEVWSLVGETNVLAEEGMVGERAQIAFHTVLRSDPTEVRARYYLGLAAEQQGQHEKAIAIWRHLELTSPADAPWMRLVRMRLNQAAELGGLDLQTVPPQHPLAVMEDPAGRPAVAEGADSNGSGGVPLSSLGEDERQMVGDMVQRLRDRLADAPEDAEGWARLGRSLYVMRDYTGAAEAYGRVTALQPNNVDAHFDRISALLGAARASGAERPDPAFFETVTALQTLAPEEPDTLYLIALAAEMDGRREDAIAGYRALLAVLPADAPARPDLEAQIEALESQ